MANIILFTDIAPKSVLGSDQKSSLLYSSRPAGPYVLASWLRSLGYSVLVVPHSFSISKKGLFGYILRNSKDLLWVGLSTTFMSAWGIELTQYRERWHTLDENLCGNELLFKSNGELAKTTPSELVWGVDELNSIAEFLEINFEDVPLILGGSFVTHFTNANLNISALSKKVYLVPGNAEMYVKTISERLTNKMGMPIELVDNYAYDYVAFKITPLIYTDDDFIEPNEWIPFEVSRGCAFNCAYCGYDKKNTRDNYKIETLRDEIIKNYESYGVTKFAILDDLYNDSPDKVKILYDKVWSKLPFKPEWVSYMRLDLLWAYPETAEIIKESGCKFASFGIETLHDLAGKKVGKGLGKARIIETLTSLKEVWGDDVYRHGLFIAGLPFEPIESIKETINWVQTTDLIHGYEFFPHFIASPSMRDRLTVISSIGKDNEKYGITWNKDGWVNSAGVTLSIATKLAKEALAGSPNGTSFTKTDFTGMRSLGLSTSEIIELRKKPEYNTVMASLLEMQDAKIKNRLFKIFNVTDK